MPLPLRDRFEAKVIRAENGCWYWSAGHFQKTGYALFCIKCDDGKWRPTVAHRISYELYVGPIPPGLQLDHLCHTRDKSCPGGDTCPHRGCVNPEHLEPVTPLVNGRRGRSPSMISAAENRCQQGHEFTAENTILRPNRPGKRECRTCVRARDRIRNKTEKRRAHYRAMSRRRKRVASP